MVKECLHDLITLLLLCSIIHVSVYIDSGMVHAYGKSTEPLVHNGGIS
jgi:hypothetical protein